MSEIKPVAYLYKIRGGVRHQTIEFVSLTDDDTCWQNCDDGEYELLSVSPLPSPETVQYLQSQNARLLEELKKLRKFVDVFSGEKINKMKKSVDTIIAEAGRAQ